MKKILYFLGKKVVHKTLQDDDVTCSSIHARNTDDRLFHANETIVQHNEKQNVSEDIINDTYFHYANTTDPNIDNPDLSLIKDKKIITDNSVENVHTFYNSTSIGTLESEDIVITSLPDSSTSNVIDSQIGDNRVLLDTIHLSKSSKVEELINRFNNSDSITELIKKSFVEKDNIKDFLLNSNSVGEGIGTYESKGDDFACIDQNNFWNYIYKQDYKLLLEKLYSFTREVVLHPEKSLHDDETLLMIRIYDNYYNNEKVVHYHNDFFSLYPEASIVLSLLFTSGLAYALHCTTQSKVYTAFERDEMNNSPNWSRLCAEQIYTESPFNRLTAFIYPFCGNRFSQNNINVENLILKTGNTEHLLDVGYVQTHMFTILFTNEYLKKRYSSFLLTTGRIGHEHPFFLEIMDKTPLKVTHENEETQRQLKILLHDENGDDTLEEKNLMLLKGSKFLGKIIFQGLLDPAVISAINLVG